MLRLVSLFGLVVLLSLAWLLSSRREQVPWRTLIAGVVLQLFLAFALLSTAVRHRLFELINAIFTAIQSFVAEGTKFVFGVNAGNDPEGRTAELLSTFAFGVLPTIVFFGALLGVLYHLGVVQFIVRGMAWFMPTSSPHPRLASISA